MLLGKDCTGTTTLRHEDKRAGVYCSREVSRRILGALESARQ